MKALLNKFKNMPESVKATLVFAIASFATSGIDYLLGRTAEKRPYPKR